MKRPNLAWLVALFCVVLTLDVNAEKREFYLGDAPPAPTDVSGLPRGHKLLSVTGGFTVNTASREEVRSFYNAVYASSDGIPMESLADVVNCTPGTSSAEFDNATLRRINWFRAMAGIPASVTFAEVNNVKDRQAAVMMSANNTLSHYPSNNWFCYTEAGAEAARNSNLALGSAGAESITGYIWDFGANNNVAGHRRWILYPQTQIMGTGDVPDKNGFSAANAIWVFDGNYGGARPATRTPYVAWPPPGFVPYPVVFPRWSFAYPSANFTNATITMRSNGVAVLVAKEPVVSGVGENSLVWVPMGLDANSFNTDFPFNGADTVYSVAISNIVGAPQSWYTYTVTVFDPAVAGADYFPPVISGPNQPSVGSANAYTLSAVPNATSYEWRSTLRTPYSLSDGAESGTGNFIVNTSAGYAVQDSNVKASGNYAFRLAHPVPAADQTLTLTKVFAPASNGSLTVKSRLGYAADGETARIQVSTNAGASWQDIFSQSGIGNGTTSPVENGFVSRAFPLGGYANKSLQLRFNYTYTSGFNYIYPQSNFPIGWYLDDIVLTNAELLTTQGTNTTATTSFTFAPSQTGNYYLDARALIFTEFPLDWGPIKTVTAVPGAPSIVLSRPLLTNSQVWLNFTVQSISSATFKLLQADQSQGPWTTNASAILTTNTPGLSYRFTASPAGNAKFYRVKTP